MNACTACCAKSGRKRINQNEPGSFLRAGFRCVPAEPLQIMNWTIAIVGGLAFGAFFLFKRMSFVSAATARKYLQQGALVIDVRSPEEFRSGHVAKAVNIPLGDLRENLPCLVKDKNQVLLLHCLSGTRSGIAKRQLKGMGYHNAFNLGSYHRAQQIISTATRN